MSHSDVMPKRASGWEFSYVRGPIFDSFTNVWSSVSGS